MSQLDIFGNVIDTTTITKEVERIAEKYPSYVREEESVENFFFIVMKERYPWISQNDIYERDLRAFAKDVLSLDRTRRKHIEKDREAKF